MINEIKNTQLVLKDDLLIALDSISAAFVIIDKEWKFVYLNKNAEKFNSHTREELIGKNVFDIFPQFKESSSYPYYKTAMETGKEIEYESYLAQKKMWIEYHISPGPHGLSIYMVDITEKKELKENLKYSELRFKQLYESPILGIVIAKTTGEILESNTAFSKMTGYSKEDIESGKLRWDKITPPEFKEVEIKALEELKLKTAIAPYEKSYIRKDGTLLPVLLGLAPLDEDSHTFIKFVLDMSKQKKFEAEMQYLARHDPLTNLPNRTLLKEGFEEALKQAQEKGKMLAVLFVDLDRFKIINDTLGHIWGDKLLMEIAERMRKVVRNDDIIARIGGDEFLILLQDIYESNDAVDVAKKILNTFEKSFHLNTHELHITASIGISFYPHDGKDSATLLRNADTAMYRVKEQGKNNYELYSPLLNERAMEKLILENNLQHALERNELVVYYQPQIDLKTKEIVGAETLLRWKHPTLGIISPNDFIPIAEETNLITPITKWILEQACNQNKKWQDMGYKPIQISVNLSGETLKKRQWDQLIIDPLKKSGMDPKYLEIEITEHSIMKNTQQIIKTFSNLRSLGIKFAIDDFGTGYSSLSYLSRFPLDDIKIDQSFMRYITSDADDAAIISAIVSMAHKIDLRVIGEGIENQTQVDLLRSMNCNIGQGYFFSLPLPANEIEKLFTLQRDVILNK